MVIKTGLTGALIYAGMLAFLWAAIGLHLRSWTVGRMLFRLGFAATAAALVARWVQVGHPPMQSMFEVFLCLGAAVYPLSVFWRRRLGAKGEAADALIALIVLVPAGFVFHDAPQRLPPALQSWLFVPHVAAYMLAYVVLFKAGLLALGEMVCPSADPSLAEPINRLVRLGFPLLTAGLLLGAWWGKKAWGDYWNWDPKELWSLATWLVFLAYLHLRLLPRHRPRLASAMVVAGTVCIVLTLVWVNVAARLFPGMHNYAS